MEYKISVIVPIYNAEKYLEQCVDSIINQTYKNLEIILVDDGSTDDSPSICDNYAKMDSRVRVLHKKNGGQADARNCGLEISSGNYIGFVDSDDYIDEKLFETLLFLCLENDVPCSSVRYDEVINGIVRNKECDKHLTILNTEEYLECIALKNKKNLITFSVWGMLYKKEIVEKLRFFVGRIYEDVYFNVNAITNAKHCAYLDVSMYHYRILNNSTVRKKRVSGIVHSYIPEFTRVISYLEINGSNTVNYFKNYAYCEVMPILAESEAKDFKEIINEFLNLVRLNCNEIYLFPISKNKKIVLCMKHKFYAGYIFLRKLKIIIYSLEGKK